MVPIGWFIKLLLIALLTIAGFAGVPLHWGLWSYVLFAAALVLLIWAIKESTNRKDRPPYPPEHYDNLIR